MKVLKATQAQMEYIEDAFLDYTQTKYPHKQLIIFQQDINNEWVIGTQNRTNEYFETIVTKVGVKTVHDIILELEEIDYAPPVNE